MPGSNTHVFSIGCKLPQAIALRGSNTHVFSIGCKLPQAIALRGSNTHVFSIGRKLPQAIALMRPSLRRTQSYGNLPYNKNNSIQDN